MPLTHQIILGVIVAGFILYPVVLMWGWIRTRGWQEGPIGQPKDASPKVGKLDADQGHAPKKAA